MEFKGLDPELAAKLHATLAEELLRRLTAPACKTCLRSPATHQELTAIMRFLSDNGVTDTVRPASPLRRLVDNLPFEEPGDPVTKSA